MNVFGRLGYIFMLTRLSTAISEVFSPFVLSGLLITLIAISTDPSWGIPVAVSLFFFVGIPLVLSLWMHRTGRITDRFIEVRKQRTPFYLGTLLSYLIGAVSLNVMQTSHEVKLALNLSVAMLIAVLIVNLKIKVSVHALVAALFCVVFPLYTPIPALSYLAGAMVWGLTVWARFHLKRHSFVELTLGSVFGVLLAVVYLHWR